MKRSEIYLRAAELVDAGEYEHACIAISCQNAARPIHSTFFTELFMPEGWRWSGGGWGRVWGHGLPERLDRELTDGELKEAQSCRVLALLFASQIAKDEER